MLRTTNFVSQKWSKLLGWSEMTSDEPHDRSRHVMLAHVVSHVGNQRKQPWRRVSTMYGDQPCWQLFNSTTQTILQPSVNIINHESMSCQRNVDASGTSQHRCVVLANATPGNFGGGFLFFEAPKTGGIWKAIPTGFFGTNGIFTYMNSCFSW